MPLSSCVIVDPSERLLSEARLFGGVLNPFEFEFSTPIIEFSQIPPKNKGKQNLCCNGIANSELLQWVASNHHQELIPYILRVRTTLCLHWKLQHT